MAKTNDEEIRELTHLLIDYVFRTEESALPTGITRENKEVLLVSSIQISKMKNVAYKLNELLG